jgi:hypothetical protein
MYMPWVNPSLGSCGGTLFHVVEDPGRKSLVPGAHTFGSWGWTREGEEEPHATIGYEADLTDPKAAWLRLHYQSRAEPVDTASGL